jgi:hypothetical protein
MAVLTIVGTVSRGPWVSSCQTTNGSMEMVALGPHSVSFFQYSRVISDSSHRIAFTVTGERENYAGLGRFISHTAVQTTHVR